MLLVGIMGGFIAPILIAKMVRNVSILLLWGEPLVVIKKIKCKTISNNGGERGDVCCIVVSHMILHI